MRSGSITSDVVDSTTASTSFKFNSFVFVSTAKRISTGGKFVVISGPAAVQGEGVKRNTRDVVGKLFRRGIVSNSLEMFTAVGWNMVRCAAASSANFVVTSGVAGISCKMYPTIADVAVKVFQSQ